MPVRQALDRWGATLARAVAAVGSGVLLWVSFPPLEHSGAAWLALVPLILLTLVTPPRQAFAWGFLSGLVFWLATLVWFLRLTDSSGVPLAIVGLGWVALAAYCALYTGAFCAAVSFWRRAWGFGEIWRSVVYVFGIPVLWVGFEYLRYNLFGGFAWNAVGVSQFRSYPILQIAEWGGAYLVSGVLLLLNASLAVTAARYAKWPPFGQRYRPHPELFGALTVVCVCIVWGAGRCRAYTSVDGNALIATIQPNVTQVAKWTEEQASDTYEKLDTLTTEAMAFAEVFGKRRPDLVVWPETTTPDYVLESTQCLAFVTALAARGSPLLVGSVDYSGHAEDYQFYNNAVLFDTNGVVRDVYAKQHLVPFGEYIPMESWIPLLKRLAPLGWSCTPGTRSTVFHTGNGLLAFSSLICFEDTVAGLSRCFVAQGARLLINQTNDAWFDNTIEARQHTSQFVFRCVENRVPAVRSANTGLTCFIDRNGRIYHGALQTEHGIAGASDGPAQALRPTYDVSWVAVPGDAMPLTFYTRYGDRFFALPCAVLAALTLAVGLVAERRRGDPGPGADA